QRVWQQPSENKSLLSWWDQARGRRVSTLLVVRDDPYYARALAGAERLVWPPPLGFRMSTRLRVFDSKLVTLDELAALASAAGLEPVRFAAAQSPPRYLVHSAAGF